MSQNRRAALRRLDDPATPAPDDPTAGRRTLEPSSPEVTTDPGLEVFAEESAARDPLAANGESLEEKHGALELFPSEGDKETPAAKTADESGLCVLGFDDIPLERARPDVIAPPLAHQVLEPPAAPSARRHILKRLALLGGTAAAIVTITLLIGMPWIPATTPESTVAADVPRRKTAQPAPADAVTKPLPAQTFAASLEPLAPASEAIPTSVAGSPPASESQPQPQPPIPAPRDAPAQLAREAAASPSSVAAPPARPIGPAVETRPPVAEPREAVITPPVSAARLESQPIGAPVPSVTPPSPRSPDPGPAAPPVTSPSSAATPETVPASPPGETAPAAVREIAAIRSVIARYGDAFSGLDALAVGEVWPSVDGRALDRAFRGLEEQGVAFDDCDITVNGGEAAATCRGTVRYVTRIGNRTPRTERRTWQFALRQTGTAWVIDRVNSR